MLARPVAFLCGLLMAAMVAVAPSRAQPQNARFESQLRGSKYEENDPERLRQLVAYSGSLFQALGLRRGSRRAYGGACHSNRAWCARRPEFRELDWPVGGHRAKAWQRPGRRPVLRGAEVASTSLAARAAAVLPGSQRRLVQALRCRSR